MKSVRCLLLSFICLAGGAFAAPGGVNSNLQLWVKANQGAHLDASDRVKILNDNSTHGRNLSDVSAGNHPKWLDGGTQLFNFNPYMDFTQSGNGDVLGFSSGGNGVGTTAGSSATLFVVARKTSSSTGWNTLMEFGSEQPSMAVNNNKVFLQTPGGDADANVVGDSFSINQPHIISYTWTDTGTNGGNSNIEMTLDGKVSSDTANNYINNINTDAFYIGAGAGVFNNEPWVGEVAESAIYSSRLDTPTIDRLKVTSYLALKYGITLDAAVADYVNSSGTSVFATAGMTDIAGIARDDAAQLNQRIAKSVNSTAVLTVSTDSDFVSPNPAHADTLSNGGYLVWGHNGASATAATTLDVDTTKYRSRIPREWKIKNTGVTQAVNLYFSGFLNAPGLEYFLLVDDDGDFTNGGTTELASSSQTIFTDVVVPADATRYLTIAVKAPSPGGVAQQMKFWAKADGEISYDLSTNKVTQWNDVSGNGAHVDNMGAVDDPVFTSASSADAQMNFHPYLTFDDDVLSNSAGNVSVSGNSATVFVVARRTSDNSAGSSTLLEWGAGQPFMGLTATQTVRVENGGGVTGGVTQKDQRHIISYDWADSGDMAASVDGVRNPVPENIGAPVTSVFTLGNSNSAISDKPFRGDIAEVIIYDSQLGDAERKRVHSSLAIKYGITLPTEYVNSTGTAVYPVDSTYNKGIIGLAKDVLSGLDQRISTPAAGAVLTLLTDNDFTANNTSHNDSLTDGQFLILGHNGASAETSSKSDLQAATYRSRMAREWKVVNTGAVSSVGLQFSGAEVGFPGASYYLLGSVGSDFENGVVNVLGVSNGTAAFSNVSFPEGTSYFTVAVTGPGPAGITDNLEFWIRADQGVSANGSNEITAWGDSAGSGFNANTPIPNAPKLTASSFNFNPAIDFDGVNDVLTFPFDVDPAVPVATGNPLSFYVAYKLRATNAGLLGNENGGSDTRIRTDLISADNGDFVGHTTKANVANQARLISVDFNYAVSGGSTAYVNGVSQGVFTYDNITTTDGLPDLRLGNDGASSFLNGEIAEVIAYRGGSLQTTATRNKIASYLAIKYGISLEVDVNLDEYIDSAGTAVYDIDDDDNNTTDWFGIAGIAKDVGAGLDQRISKSGTTGAVFIGSVDTNFSNTNTSHSATVLADKQYIVWGHNNGTTDITQTTELASLYQVRMAREWKLQSTAASSLNIKIEGLAETLGTTYHLLSDTDGDKNFDDAVSIATSTTGEFTGVSLAAGTHHLTIAVTKPSPGGELANAVLWLRADKGIADDGTQLISWSDLSGAGNSATSYDSDPHLLTGQMNFNPAVDFDGNDTAILPLNINPSQGDPLQLYVVYQQDDTTDNGLIGNDNGGSDTRIQTNEISADGTDFVGHAAAANIINTTKLISVNFDHGASGGSTAYVDGAAQGSFTYNNAGGGLTTTRIGSRGDSNDVMDGRVAEVIAYRGSPQSNDSRQKVSSYLSLKYGFSLQGSDYRYLGANGAEIFNRQQLGGDGSLGNPFASVGAASAVTTAGDYHFLVNGQMFKTHVDANGWVLVILGEKNTAADTYTTTNDLTVNGADKTLPKDVFTSAFGDVTEVRISSDTTLDMVSNKSIVLDRLRDYTALSYAKNDHLLWSGVGSGEAITGDTCIPTSPLNVRIYHGCDNGAALHWIPGLPGAKNEGVIFPGSNDLSLWVRAAAGTGDIAGIAKDKLSDLDQRISKSINSTASLTVSTDGDFTAVNTSHADTLGDGQYLVWGHNGGSLSKLQTSDLDTASYQQRIPREWKVQNTNVSSTVNLSFSGLPSAPGTTYYLLGDADGDFSSGAIELGSASLSRFTNIPFKGRAEVVAMPEILGPPLVPAVLGVPGIAALPDIFYLTVAVKVAAPGGVFGDLAMWFKGEGSSAVDSNGDFTGTLIDESGSTSGTWDKNGDPKYKDNQLNFHGYIEFDNSGDYFKYSGTDFTSTWTGGDRFMVLRDDAPTASTGTPFSVGLNVSADTMNEHYIFSNDQLYTPFGSDNRKAWNVKTGAIVAGQSDGTGVALNINAGNWHLFNTRAGDDPETLAADDKWVAEFDSVEAFRDNTNNAQFSSPALYVGGAPNFGATTVRTFDGDIAEGLAFSRVLTNVERTKVNTYLGLKYGITQGSSSSTFTYKSSTNVDVWAHDAAYQKNIIGLARDSGSGLDQRIAKSSNADATLTLSTNNNFTSSNITHTSILSDGQFLIVGNNGAGFGLDSDVDKDPSFTKRMARQWKVQNTGVTTPVNIKIDVPVLGGVRYYLLSDSDGNFSNAGQSSVVANSTNGEFLNIANIPQGVSYLTVAVIRSTPGGVSNGLNFWLRADAVENNNIGNGWKDQSGNARDFSVAGNPQLSLDSLNFNPAVDFDGSGDVFSIAALNMDLHTVYMVYKHTSIGDYETPFTGGITGAMGYSTFHGDDGTSGDVYHPSFTPENTRNGTNFVNGVNTNLVTYKRPQNYELHTRVLVSKETRTQPYYVGTDRNIPGRDMAGGIAEVLSYSTDHATLSSDRAKIESYLGLKYGISLSGTIQNYVNSSGASVFNVSSAAGTGALGSSTNPFTSMGAARSVTTAGTYYFNVNSQVFSTYVDTNGWVLAASGAASTPAAVYGNAPTVTPGAGPLTLQSDRTLPSSVFTHAFANVNEVRINSTSGTGTAVDMTSTATDVLDQLRSYKTLSYKFDDHKDWTGAGSEFVIPTTTAACGPYDLNESIYHGCGNSAAAMHWIPGYPVNPSQRREGVTFDDSNDLNLWVRAPLGGVVTWRGIAGLVKDDAAGLDQRIGKSSSAGAVLTVSTDTNFTSANTSHADSLSDGQYLVWGHNDGAVSLDSTAELDLNSFSQRMLREWRVTNTGAASAVNLKFDGLTPIGGTVYYLLVSTGEDFSNVSSVATSTDGTFSNISFTGTRHFTVAKSSVGPGGVAENLAFWARADAGVTDPSTAVTEWLDQSGKGGHSSVINSNPDLLENSSMNFNPAVDFDGNDRVQMAFDVNPSKVNPLQLYVVYQQDVLAGGLIGNNNGGTDTYLAANEVSANNAVDLTQDFAADVVGQTKLISARLAHTTSGGSSVSIDGTQQSMFTFNNAEGGSSSLSLGSIGSSEYLNGRIAEVIAYGGGTQTTAERNKIESYLALKYGVPLGGQTRDYVNSGGTSVFSLDRAGNVGTRGTTAANPFTSIGAAHSVTTAGTYHFNVNSQVFSTYVDANGWVLAASGSRSTSPAVYSNAPTVTPGAGPLTLQSDRTLPSLVFTNAFTNVSEVRINSTAGPGTGVDMYSTHATVLSRLRTYDALSFKNNENDFWKGLGADKTIGCDGGSQSLNRKIYHACNNGAGMHWIPGGGHESATSGANTHDLNLWVRASATDTTMDWVGIAGIAKDEASTLDQRIAKASGTGNILTVATNTTGTGTANFTAANLTRNALADGQYLVWGHNSGSTDLTSTADLPTAYNKRMARVWKVTNTGSVGSVNLKFSGLPSLGAQFVLLRATNSNGSFGTNSVEVGVSTTGEFTGITLPSGLYTLAIKLSAPGGVLNNLGMWLKAGAGVSVDSVTKKLEDGQGWADQSGSNASFTKVEGNPVLQTSGVNFNPTIAFDGNGDYLRRDALNPNARTIYIAYQHESDDDFEAVFQNTDYVFHGDNGGASADIYHASLSSPDVRGGSSYKNGLLSDFTATKRPKSFAIESRVLTGKLNSSKNYFIASDRGIPGREITGNVAELIAYSDDHAAAATTRHKIESYLALKYGVSLDSSVGNYLRSDGSSVFDIVAGVADKGIAGLAFDNASALDQRIARSSDVGTVMTVSRDSDFTAENTAHMNPLADKQYLMWGHNGGDATQWTTNELVTNSNHQHRIAREWKFESTGGTPVAGTAITANIKISNLSPASGVVYYLISDADGDFSSGASQLGMMSTTGEFANVPIPAGTSYLTVASNIKPQITLERTNITVSDGEGDSALSVKVLLNAVFAQAVNFTYGTTNGTAIGGSDFIAIPLTTSGSFAAGVISQNINVAIIGDSDNSEDGENFTFNLADVSPAPTTTVIGTPSTLTVTITDSRLPLIGDLGKSPTTPFTSLGMSRYVGEAGTYYFAVGGQTFATRVDENGWVLVASGEGSDSTGVYTEPTAPPTPPVLTLQSNKILPLAVFMNSFASADEVRINVTAGSLDLVSNKAEILTALRNYKPLVYSDATAGIWTGTGYVAPAGVCAPGAAKKLNEIIFDGCSNAAAIHWLPEINKEGTTDSNSTDLNLWVRAPAPSSEGSRLWLEAYNGLSAVGSSLAVNGESVNAWTSQIAGGVSGVDPYANKRPLVNTNGINFNASADFQNAQQIDYSGLDTLNTPGNDPATIFVVASRAQVTSLDDDLVSFPGGPGGDSGNGTADRPSLGFASASNRLQAQVASDTYEHTRDLALNTPYVFSLRMNSIPGAGNLKLGVDGEEQSFTLNNAVDTNSLLVIGAGNNILNEAFYGSISEVLIYNKVLDDISMQQLLSYFALRYGITLTEAADPYLDSKTNYVYEVDDNADGTPDWFNVAAIFKDDLLGKDVDQRISRSQNLSSKLTISVDSNFADPMIEHADRLTAGQYLVWGSNRQQISTTTTGIASPFNRRVERYWKVQNTKSVAQVNAYIEDLPPLSSGQQYSLVSSLNTNFTAGLTVLATSASGVFSGVNFPSGVSYFTIAIGSASSNRALGGFSNLAMNALERVLNTLVPAAHAVDLFDVVLGSEIEKAKAKAEVLAFALHEPGVSEPSLATYVKAGISGLSASNISALNSFIRASNTDFVHLIANLQTLVNRIQRFRKNGSPVVADFELVGITGVSAGNLNEVKALLDAKLSAGELAESPIFVQSVSDSVAALAAIRSAAQNDDASGLNVAVFNQVLDVVGFESGNLSLYQSVIAAVESNQFLMVSGLNEVVDISNRVLAMANEAAVSLSLADLNKITITGVTAGNLSSARDAIKNSTPEQVDTVAEIQSVVSAAVASGGSTGGGTAAACASNEFGKLAWFVCMGVTGLTADNFSVVEAEVMAQFATGSITSANLIPKTQEIVDGLSGGAPDLSSVVAAANSGDASSISIAALNSITGLVNVSAANELAYQSFIAAVTGEQVDSLSELQSLLDFISKVIAQAANNTNASPTLTTADFAAYGLSVNADTLEAVLLAIAATADNGSEVDSYAELQSLVNTAVASANALAAIVTAADNSDASSIDVAALNAITGLVNVAAVNELAYQSFIAAVTGEQVDSLSELQSLLDFINKVIAQAANNMNASPALTVAEFTAYGLSVDADSLNSVLLAIAATADNGEGVNTYDKLKVVTDKAVARYQVLVKVLEDSLSGSANADGINVTLADLKILDEVKQLVSTLEGEYQMKIAGASFTGLPTPVQIQALVDAVNTAFITLDTDKDGLTDLYETKLSMNLNDASMPILNGELDGDGDGLTAAQEAEAGFDDLSMDSESSKTTAIEAANGIYDALEDLDGDGIPSKSELMFGFSATDGNDPVAGGASAAAADNAKTFLERIGIPSVSSSSDYDEDGIPDVEELLKGSNPLKATVSVVEPTPAQVPSSPATVETQTPEAPATSLGAAGHWSMQLSVFCLLLLLWQRGWLRRARAGS